MAQWPQEWPKKWQKDKKKKKKKINMYDIVQMKLTKSLKIKESLANQHHDFRHVYV